LEQPVDLPRDLGDVVGRLAFGRELRDQLLAGDRLRECLVPINDPDQPLPELRAQNGEYVTVQASPDVYLIEDVPDLAAVPEAPGMAEELARFDAWQHRDRRRVRQQDGDVQIRYPGHRIEVDGGARG